MSVDSRDQMEDDAVHFIQRLKFSDKERDLFFNITLLFIYACHVSRVVLFYMRDRYDLPSVARY